MEVLNGLGQFYNEDCVTGCRRHVADNSVDLIITDPPYGIEGHKLHKHYNRKEEFVLDGYVEVPTAEYADFSRRWIKEAERILRPGGSIYIVSGYTHLVDILNALRETKLREINHIVWKYNFGVYTRKKYISSHYHILFYSKPGPRFIFNTFCRYGAQENHKTGSLNYRDREDVWIVNREYKPGKVKNKNELPLQLLTKMIQYSSDEGDLVCDLFLGSFSTAKVAIGLNRRAVGFEISKTAFDHQVAEVRKLAPGQLLTGIRKPVHIEPKRQGEAWSEEEREQVVLRYRLLYQKHGSKKNTIEELCKEFGRGRWSIEKVLKQAPNVSGAPQGDLVEFISRRSAHRA